MKKFNVNGAPIRVKIIGMPEETYEDTMLIL